MKIGENTNNIIPALMLESEKSANQSSARDSLDISINDKNNLPIINSHLVNDKSATSSSLLNQISAKSNELKRVAEYSPTTSPSQEINPSKFFAQ